MNINERVELAQFESDCAMLIYRKRNTGTGEGEWKGNDNSVRGKEGRGDEEVIKYVEELKKNVIAMKEENEEMKKNIVSETREHLKQMDELQSENRDLKCIG